MFYDENGKTEEFVKDKITGFLRSIPIDDVLQVARTSTGGLIRATTLEEAIEIILRYSDAVTLLNRRKIKTNYLADYLHSCQVRFSIPANKTTLSRIVLQHWGIDSKDYEFEDGDSPPPTRSTPRQRHDSGVVTPYMLQPSDSSMKILPSVQFPSAEETGQTLAFQFVSWFYAILNNQTDFNSNHFWPNCILHMEVIGVAPEPIVKEVKGGEEACSTLKSLILQERIQFNPNTINGTGVQGSISPHGLVEVKTWGSAHRANSEFGLFEQAFNLLRDPQYANNYKILSTILLFRKGVNAASMSAGHYITER